MHNMNLLKIRLKIWRIVLITKDLAFFFNYTYFLNDPVLPIDIIGWASFHSTSVFLTLTPDSYIYIYMFLYFSRIFKISVKLTVYVLTYWWLGDVSSDKINVQFTRVRACAWIFPWKQT